MSDERKPLWDIDQIGDLAKECTDELDGGMYVYHVIFNALFKVSGDLSAVLAAAFYGSTVIIGVGSSVAMGVMRIVCVGTILDFNSSIK